MAARTFSHDLLVATHGSLYVFEQGPDVRAWLAATPSSAAQLRTAALSASPQSFALPDVIQGITAISINEGAPGTEDEFPTPAEYPDFHIPFFGHLYVQFWQGNTPRFHQEAGPSGPGGTGFLITQNYPETPEADPHLFIQFGNGSAFETNHAGNYLASEQSFYRKTGNFPRYSKLFLNSNTYIDAMLLAYGCSENEIALAIADLAKKSHRYPIASGDGSSIETLLEPLGMPWPMAPRCRISV